VTVRTQNYDNIVIRLFFDFTSLYLKFNMPDSNQNTMEAYSCETHKTSL